MRDMDDYRRSQEFYLVLGECIIAARNEEHRHYKDIAEHLPDVPSSGSYMANQTGRVLGAVSEEMHESDLPMVSAVVVRTSDERPGPGFYKLAHKLGRLGRGPDELTDDKKERFWRAELERVYEVWS